MGVPSSYTPDLGEQICAEIIDGKSVRSICAMDGMPSKKTVMHWLRTFAEFKELYDRACMERAEAYAEEIVDIADDGSNDWMASNDPDNAGYKLNGEHVQRSKLRMEARKWICAKMKPKKYGEKIDHQHTGAGGGPIEVVSRIELVDLDANGADRAPEED